MQRKKETDVLRDMKWVNGVLAMLYSGDGNTGHCYTRLPY